MKNNNINNFSVASVVESELIFQELILRYIKQFLMKTYLVVLFVLCSAFCLHMEDDSVADLSFWELEELANERLYQFMANDPVYSEYIFQGAVLQSPEISFLTALSSDGKKEFVRVALEYGEADEETITNQMMKIPEIRQLVMSAFPGAMPSHLASHLYQGIKGKH